MHHATLEQRWVLTAKAVLLVAGLSAVALFANGNFTVVHFVVLWAILFGAGVTNLRGAAVLSVTLLSSLVVASPLLLHLFEFRSAMARLETHHSVPVRLATLFIFFMPAWIALALLCFQKKPREHIYQLTYLIGAVVALLLSSKGDLWGFRNHQYRFAILLIFPLSILFAIAIFTRWRSGLRVVVTLLVVWVSASILRNLAGISGVDKNIYNALGAFYNYVDYSYADRDSETYLLTLRTATEEAKQAGSRRILLAPEYSYPKGLRDSALALGVSQLPAFIPDYRYLIDTASYADRLRIFCFLFPGYPHFDAHTGLRACTGVDGSLILNEGRPIFSIRDPSLKANILDLLGIAVLADLGSPFRKELLKYADAYDMQAIMSSQHPLVMRRSARRDRPVITSKSRDAEGINFTVTAPSSSRYVVILAGQDILSRFSEIRFADKQEQRWELRRDVVIGEVALNAGANDLRLVGCRGTKETQSPEQTPFYFVAAIRKDNFDNLISTEQLLPQLGMNPASVASTCPEGLLKKAF